MNQMHANKIINCIEVLTKLYHSKTTTTGNNITKSLTKFWHLSVLLFYPLPHPRIIQ